MAYYSTKTYGHNIGLSAVFRQPNENDDKLHYFHVLEEAGLAQLTILDGVGAEKFAEHAWRFADELVKEMSGGRCWCESAECAEHGSNSAIYTPFTVQKISNI